MAEQKGFDFMGLLSGLPASLIFILAVDWKFVPDTINLYLEQNKTHDEYKVYTLIAIGTIVVVNLIIISAFARVRYLYERAKIPQALTEPPSL